MISRQIKTVEDLEDAITKEYSWRGKEIEQIRIRVKNSNNGNGKGRPLTLEEKSWILILYANWEGFINVAANLYVQYVFAQGIPLIKLKTGFWEIQIHPSFENFKNIRSQDAKKKFLDQLRESFSLTRFREYKNDHKKRYISTNSNLDSETFMGILDILSLNESKFDLSKNFIDSILLNYRNGLAHGERGYDVDFSDMLDTIDYITKLMKEFQECIIDAAQKKTYLSGTNE